MKAAPQKHTPDIVKIKEQIRTDNGSRKSLAFFITYRLPYGGL